MMRDEYWQKIHHVKKADCCATCKLGLVSYEYVKCLAMTELKDDDFESWDDTNPDMGLTDICDLYERKD